MDTISISFVLTFLDHSESICTGICEENSKPESRVPYSTVEWTNRPNRPRGLRRECCATRNEGSDSSWLSRLWSFTAGVPLFAEARVSYSVCDRACGIRVHAEHTPTRGEPVAGPRQGTRLGRHVGEYKRAEKERIIC